MKNKKVVLGMSGGVDSSIAAFLLKRKGYEVYGFFMNCGPRGKVPWPTSINWLEEEKIVRKICEILGIKLFVKDCEESYEKNIISPMFKDYKKGFTPNPDILCNNSGKFPSLLKKAKEIGADYIATGHYARVKKGKKGYELLMGKDKTKDQSYFLVGLNQKFLSKILFPVGELTKEQVRRLAKANNFPNWNKQGSRGICYLGKIDMKKFLHERIKEKKGKIADTEGKIIGEHKGTEFFTIGEKIGEGKGTVLDNKFRNKFGGRWYVARKEKGNVLVVAPENHPILKTKKVFIKKFHLINSKEKIPKRKLKARIRHLGELNKGSLSKKGKRRKFIFDKGVKGIAEGQFIVLYEGKKVVGGGEVRLK
jgi:tRNA-specific 2-thiouridylase